MITLNDTFDILVNSVIEKSSKKLNCLCPKYGMVSLPYLETGGDNLLPEFDRGYNYL